MGLKATCSIVSFVELLSPVLSIPLTGNCCCRLARGSRIECASRGYFFLIAFARDSHVSDAAALWRGEAPLGRSPNDLQVEQKQQA
jgi:hypothetical protein